MKNQHIEELDSRIRTKKAKIGVVGLGYVGLPLALAFTKKGYSVVGIDIDRDRILRIRKGVSYITDVSEKEIKRALQKKLFRVSPGFAGVRELDVIIICVPTPIGRHRRPDISFIKGAALEVKRRMRPGQLIVLESTTYPGTTKEILLPIFESGKLKEGEDFFLAFSPERIDPGNEIYKTENTPKIIGGISAASSKIATRLYRGVIKKVIPVSSASAAEMVKLLENTFRIVNIALVNEMAVLCDKFGLDIWEIVDAAKTKPYGYMPFYPGPGCGGHCIPVDPLYLSWKAKEVGFRTKFINLAASVNESMPEYVVKRLERILAGKGRSLANSNVLIAGVAYKKDIKDLRESPAIRIIRHLQRKRVNVSYADTFFPYLRLHGIDLKGKALTKENIAAQDCVVIATDHSSVDYRFLAEKSRTILDTRGVLRKIIKSGKLKGKIFNL